MSLMKMLNKTGPIMEPWAHLCALGEKHFGRYLSSHIAPCPKGSCLTMTRQIPPSYTHAVFQAVVCEVGNRKPSRDPSGWHQQNDHDRTIVSSLRSGPEVLIGSYTLCGMPIEKDGNPLESSHPIGPPWLSQISLNEWVIHCVERGSSVGRMPDSQSREPGFEPR